MVSVVINTLLGSPYTERCIEALLQQRNAPPLEIIVPVYPLLDDVDHLARAYARYVRFVPAGNLPPGADPSRPGRAHMIYERRRAVGLSAATGDIIALTEDQIIPDPGWCASIVRAHAGPYRVIGGAVENGGKGALHRALYLCDFGRYQRPFPAHASPYLTDQNVSYKRAALEKVRHVWSVAYHEPAVHDAMRAAGETLWLTPDCVVRQDRGKLRLLPQLRERYAWGRVFGGTRTRRIPAWKRALLLVMSPVIPFLIVGRLLKKNCLETLAALPAILLMAVCWGSGEATGYLTEQPFPSSYEVMAPELAGSEANDTKDGEVILRR